MKIWLVTLTLLQASFLLLFVSACHEASVVTQEVVEQRNAQVSPPKIIGTWRETDGSTYILINETKIVFFAPNALVEHFWDYVYDEETLEVYSSGTLMTIQEVQFDGYQMVLTEVYGEGYDGIYNRTGGF